LAFGILKSNLLFNHFKFVREEWSINFGASQHAKMQSPQKAAKKTAFIFNRNQN